MECPRCGLPLPLREPDRGEADRWECHNCGERVRGMFDQDARQSIRYNCEPDFTGNVDASAPVP